MANEPEDADEGKVKQLRLPREDDALRVPYDEKPPLIDTAKAILGPRLKETRWGFLLDGKPANTDKVLAAANLRYRDAAA